MCRLGSAAGKILNLKKHTSGRAVNAAFTNCLTPTGSRGLMTEGGRGWNLLENRSLVSLPVRRMLAFVKVGGKKTAWCFSTCVVLFLVFCFKKFTETLEEKKKKKFFRYFWQNSFRTKKSSCRSRKAKSLFLRHFLSFVQHEGLCVSKT